MDLGKLQMTELNFQIEMSLGSAPVFLLEWYKKDTKILQATLIAIIQALQNI